MKVSIITPTRNRLESLKRMVKSVRDNASKDVDLEFIIGVDRDDKTDYSRFNVKKMVFDREEKLTAYINALAFMATGDVVWFLGDDCEVKTKDWDIVAGQALRGVKSPIWYGDTHDTTRNFEGVGQFAGFPMISPKAIKVLGYFFHPSIASWGADKYCHHVYKEAECIVDMSGVHIHHHHITDDETSVYIEAMYRKYGSGSNLKYDLDISKLKAEK